MAASEPLLAVREIHTYYGDSYVLHGLSLELRAGQIVVILGRNGMGKTTLIRSIAGLTPPRRGDVIFEGRSFVGRPPYAISQAGVAIVPQGRRIFKSLTVRENLALPTSALAGRKHVRQPGRKHWDLQEVLKEFPQLAERLNNAGGSLSGGEQQMLAIGRALMANPSLILMDEPSEGLSPNPRSARRGDHAQPARARAFDPAGRAESCTRHVGGRQHLCHLVGTVRVPRNA